MHTLAVFFTPMSARKTLLLVCALFFCAFVYADPLNVLVGDLTFNRPEDWMWESSTGKSNILARFILPHDDNTPANTDVRFYVTQMDATSAMTTWKSFFPQARDGKDIAVENKKIGTHKLTYISLTGTQVVPGGKSRPNSTFFGAIIPSGRDFVHVRLFGPSGEVQKAIAPFKKMVEGALLEKENE